MSRKGSFSLGAALAVVPLMGCAEVAGPDGDAAAEAESLARFLAEGDVFAAWVGAAADDQRSGSSSFSRTADCPAGGTRSFSGSANHTFDPADRVVATDWTNTQKHDACAYARRSREGPLLTVVDGSVTVTGEARYRMPEDRASGRTILAYRRTRVGSVTTSSGDRSVTCLIDVVEEYDPATGTLRISGEVCGRQVDTSRTPLGRDAG